MPLPDGTSYNSYLIIGKEKIALITEPQSMTEMEAWRRVREAISYYNATENFQRLPPIIQKILGSPSQLRDWATMEAETVDSVIQSNFMRSYTAKVRAEKEFTALPESAKNLIESIKLKMLEAGNEHK